MAQTKLVVYGYFNCPYCYALHELLADSHLANSLQWRTIEHMPGVSSAVCSPKAQSVLATEVYNIRHRVPELTIAIAPCRPDTALANRLLLIVSQSAPDKAALLRRLIFQALWVDGHDISEPSVLFALLPQVDFDGSVDRAELAQENSLLQAWQRTWEESRFEHCIPVLVAEQRLLRGFVLVDDIERFLKGEEVSGDCALSEHVKPRQHIAILGELRPLWRFIATLRHQYHIHLLHSDMALAELFKQEQLPDMLLIDADAQHNHGLDFCEQLINEELTPAIPVLLVADQIAAQDEASAYRLGVADFMRRDSAPEVFKARVEQILQFKVARDELERSARLDGLTQIYNRGEFDRMLVQEWRRCARSGTLLSLLMVDIDLFKKYNDQYGHLAGDGCLRMLAQCMKKTLERTSDLVCRYGGEEFAVLLPDTNASGAYQVAQKLQRAINALNIEHASSDVASHVTVSIGCSTLLPEAEADLLELVAMADQRLYLAKDTGRNRIVAE